MTMRPPTSDAQQQLRDWLDGAQAETVTHSLVVAKTTITSSDAKTASIRTSLSNGLDPATAKLCATAAAQAFALSHTGKIATVEKLNCRIDWAPKGDVLWAEAVVLSRHEKVIHFAVDITDQNERRVAVGYVWLSIDGPHFT
jgi:hypothetical protein